MDASDMAPNQLQSDELASNCTYDTSTWIEI